MFRVIRVSDSTETTYRDCATYNEARAALDRLAHAFRFTGVVWRDSDHLQVGLRNFTLADSYRIVRI